MSIQNIFSFNKKGVELSISKLVGFFLLLIVVLLVISQFSEVSDTAEGGISDFKLKSIIEKCEISKSNCNVKVCNDDTLESCNEQETATWNSLNSYYTKCNDKNHKDYEKLNCGVLFTQIEKALSGVDNDNIWDFDSISDGAVLNSETNVVELTGSMLTKIEKFKSSIFYDLNKNQFETYASKNNVDVNLIYAIIIKEDGYRRTFEKSVRFECHKFNEENRGFDDVDCTLKNGESFSRVSKETNYDAFVEAFDANDIVAFKSSSFGFSQMLGSNIVRYENSDDADLLLSKVKDSNAMINYFFKFLEENGIINDMKNKNYQQIAKKYNGPKYAQNNYDLDLQGYYEGLA